MLVAVLMAMCGLHSGAEAGPPSTTYRIQSVATGRYLRIRTERDSVLYAVDSPNERFQDDLSTQFVIEAHMDGSYRVRSGVNGSLIYSDVRDKLLSVRQNVADADAKLIIEPAGDRVFRLKFTADGSYWHEDGLGDRQVSTRWGAKDHYTIFRFLAAHSTPDRPIQANLIDASGNTGPPIAPLGARRPIDASSEEKLPNLIPFVNEDDSIDVAWTTAKGRTIVSHFGGPQWSQSDHLEVSNALTTVAGLTKDSYGNRYLMTAAKEKVGASAKPELRRPEILKILKVPANGRTAQLFADLNQADYYSSWGIYNPLYIYQGNHSVRSQLVYGNGNFAVSFTHNIPGADGYLHDTGCILGVNIQGQPVYTDGGAMHSGDMRTIFDGQDFVQAQVHERGIVLSKLSPAGNGTLTWSNHKLVFKNEHHDLRLGGLVTSNFGYLLVFSHPNFGINPEGGLPVWFVSVPRDFQNLPTWNWPDKAEVYSNQIRSFKLALPPQNSGHRDSYERPRVASLGNGQYIVLWEYIRDGQYQKTYAQVIDQFGTPQTEAREFTDLRIHNSNDAFQLTRNRKIGWINGDSTHARMVLHTLDSSLTLQSFPLAIQ